MPRGRKTQPDYPGSLGSLLYDKRKAHGWPAKKVAAACSLSQPFIAAIERGARCPELDRVPEIARAYRLNVSLVCWTWIVQFAPRAAPYMVMPAYAHTVSDSETEIAISDSESETAMLLGMSASRGKVEAEVAAIAERRRQRWEGGIQHQRAEAQKVRMQAELDAPLPEVAPFDTPAGDAMIDSRGPQEVRLGTLPGGTDDPVHASRKS